MFRGFSLRSIDKQADARRVHQLNDGGWLRSLAGGFG